MKRPIVIANWKMNLSLAESVDLISNLKDSLGDVEKTEVVVCPSFLALEAVGKIINKTNLKLGAQNVFWVESGAYTGEVSTLGLRELGCQYVILGHSERRIHLAETNSMINKKIDACLDNNLTPIICIGETHDQRHERQTDHVIFHQLKNCLKNIHLVSNENIVIAYEPVWAIGSGEVVEADEAQRVFELIQQFLMDIYPLTIVKNNVRMIYGGSVNDDNVSRFSGLSLLDGFLVGGASLKVDKLEQIVKSL